LHPSSSIYSCSAALFPALGLKQIPGYAWAKLANFLNSLPKARAGQREQRETQRNVNKRLMDRQADR